MDVSAANDRLSDKMASISHRLFIGINMFMLLTGFLLFLHGFFPLKSPLLGRASLQDIQVEPVEIANRTTIRYEPVFDRLVFVLVDALRADFVLPRVDSTLPRMQFVEQLIKQKETHSFIAKAHPPTVTMPRIKVLL